MPPAPRGARISYGPIRKPWGTDIRCEDTRSEPSRRRLAHQAGQEQDRAAWPVVHHDVRDSPTLLESVAEDEFVLSVVCRNEMRSTVMTMSNQKGQEETMVN